MASGRAGWWTEGEKHSQNGPNSTHGAGKYSVRGRLEKFFLYNGDLLLFLMTEIKWTDVSLRHTAMHVKTVL